MGELVAFGPKLGSQELLLRRIDGEGVGDLVRGAAVRQRDDQAEPGGALGQGEDLALTVLADDHVALVLGDNIFYGDGLPARLRQSAVPRPGAIIFGYQVRQPQAYGVIEFAADGEPSGIVEKPRQPRSHWAVTGLYFYDNTAPDIAQSLKPSARGEFEITDLNNVYLSRGMLTVASLRSSSIVVDRGSTAEVRVVMPP